MGGEAGKQGRERIDDGAGALTRSDLMIKQCPTCNRTYSDESISFCLADGALLSAPYDGPKEEPPPTEILPEAHNPVAATEAAPPAVPTLTSLPGARKYSPLPANQPQSNQQSRALILLAVAILAVAALVIGGVAARRLFAKRSAAAQTTNPAAPIGQSSPLSTATPFDPANSAATPDHSKAKPTPTPAVGPNVVQPAPEPKSSALPLPATLEADPALFPPANRPTPKETTTVDYNRVFSPKEVDTKVRLLNKPSPSYTEEARKNTVQGTVVLRVIFSADGSVGSITPIRSLPYGLTEKAVAAARQIKFQPAMKDGRPVSVAMVVEYNFNVY